MSPAIGNNVNVKRSCAVHCLFLVKTYDKDNLKTEATKLKAQLRLN